MIHNIIYMIGTAFMLWFLRIVVALNMQNYRTVKKFNQSGIILNMRS